MGHPKLSPTDLEEIEGLVHRAKVGDESAMAGLIQKTSASLFRFLLFLGGSRELADDLVQETYLYALEHIGTLKKEGAFPKWLFLVARNKFLDHKRSPRNQPHVNADDREFPHFSAEQRELHFQTKETLSQLSEEDRTVLLLVDLEGYSYGEAAEVLGVRESAVVSRIYRARQRFEEAFGKK